MDSLVRHVKVGLLPLYLKLYDDTSPASRREVQRFRDTISDELSRRGLRVMTAPVCRVRSEIDTAVQGFEVGEVEAIVTLHLAYSPSEESLPALATTALPIIVLDTTPAFDFSPTQSPDAVMYNHGIHGVQDLCNLLLRHGKAFQLEAGHWEHSDVLDRVVQAAQSVHLANAMRSARIGRIGRPFQGMGDFAVNDERLARTLGVIVIPATPAEIGARLSGISQEDVDTEWEDDVRRFDVAGVSKTQYGPTAHVCLAVRQWMEQEHLTGFTVNFMEANRAAGLPTMPFLEASKAMARGVGYAGEGDCLTAALVGALASVFEQVSFTEMFCPDWAHDTIFLSHMGEMNVAMVAGRARLIHKPYSFIDIDDPVLAVGRFDSGLATLVNLAPGPSDTFTLIIAPVTIQEVVDADAHVDSIRGWIKPGGALPSFLAHYSRLGGTHHSALIKGDVVRIVKGFGELMSWKVEVI